MSERIRKRTKYLTVSAMLAALGVICMSLGSLVEVLDLTTAVLASMLCIYAVIEMGGGYPWAIWLATSILSLVLLPIKTPAIFYTAFFGFYPILKEKLEKRSRPIAWTFKLLAFHLSLGVIALVFHLFLPEQMTEEFPFFWLALYAASLVAFLLYDLALTRMITFYLIRLRHRFQIK
ncbi:MAG: hypothetical protein E7666_07570 [Ruminococcaceae bacterium]|nr:hypothetical protein [Oscillospiraceae bacterium]